MASINLVADGVYTDTAIWSTGTVPGAGDTVNLNGFVVTINGNWSIANMTDNGLAGSGAYINSNNTTIDISGTLTSSVVPTASTQQGNVHNGTTSPSLILYGSSATNGILTIGSIVASAKCCVVFASLYECSITVGGMQLTGTGGSVGGDLIGVSLCYGNQAQQVSIGTITAADGALAVGCWGSHVVSVTLTGACSATSGASIVAGTAVVATSEPLTATSGGFAVGGISGVSSQITVNGNISCTSSSANSLSSLAVHGTVTMSGSGSALAATSFLYADELVLENSASFALPSLTVIKKLSVDGTQTYSLSNTDTYAQTLLFYGGTANPTIPGVTTYYLPSESQVSSDVNYLNGLTGNVGVPPEGEVAAGVAYGPSGSLTGTASLMPAPTSSPGTGVGDVVTAVVAVMRADAVLSAAGISGPSLQSADETKTLPYVIVQAQRGGKIIRFLDGTSLERYVVSFSVVAESAPSVAALVSRVHDLFDGQTLKAAQGVVVQSYAQAAPAVRQLRHLSSGQPMYEAVVSANMDYMPTS
jgi:hypothetical protein